MVIQGAPNHHLKCVRWLDNLHSHDFHYVRGLSAWVEPVRRCVGSVQPVCGRDLGSESAMGTRLCVRGFDKKIISVDME